MEFDVDVLNGYIEFDIANVAVGRVCCAMFPVRVMELLLLDNDKFGRVMFVVNNPIDE